MKKTHIIILLILGYLISCSKPKAVITENFEFAVYENEPVFVDEYLFDRENKNSIKLTSDKTVWYLLDWNKNGIYNEVGIDYYGVKSPFKNRPIISILKEKNYLNHNGQTYFIDKESNFRELIKTDFKVDNEISYISNFIPIELSDGKILTADILNGFDKTVIYYWATWCAPCVEKLEQIESIKGNLVSNKVNFVPIYHKTSYNSVKELNEKKGLSFDPKEVSDLSALNYQISALPETYVFDKDGILIAESFSVEKYCP
jgi:thiol-disulfide isomerase/thioredoxin